MTVLQVLYINICEIVLGIAGIAIAIVGLKRSRVFLPSLAGAILISLSGGVGIILLRSLGEKPVEWGIPLFWMNEIGTVLASALFLLTFLLLVCKVRFAE
jgi:tetrahydromethanopterin S-methyltransferase subunit C